MRRARRVRQGAPSHQHGDDANRNIDREQPRPGSHRQNSRRQGRTHRRRNRHHQRIDADAMAQLVAGIGEAHQRGVHAHDPGSAETLNDARRGEQHQRMRQGAEKRRDREQSQARQIDAAIADDFAQRRQRQQGDGDGELIPIDDPDREGRAGVQILRDGGKRDIGDGAIDHRHHDTQHDREDRPITLGQRQAVFGMGGGD